MSSFLYFLFLFVVKVLDNALGTARTLLVQRNKSILAGLVLGVSTFLGLWITKDIVNSDGFVPIFVVSCAACAGCTLAVSVSNRFSKDRTYVNVIMSDDLDEMKKFRDFLVQHKITNTATDSYTLDWESKTLTLTAYAETREQSRLIDEYIENSDTKFKRVVQDQVVRKRKRKRVK